PHRANEERADMRREGKLERVTLPFADAVGGLGIAAGTEGALMQPLDGERIASSFRPDGEGKIGHRLVVKTPESPQAPERNMRLAFGGAEIYCGFSDGSPTCARWNRQAPSCQPGRAVCKSARTMSAANKR